MDFSEQDNSDTPKKLIAESRALAQELLPALSKERYDRIYSDFKKWVTKRNSPSISEAVLMSFFQELAQKHKPTTLWAYHSMLKSTLRANDYLDIGTYANLLSFLKQASNGYSPVKASVFSEKDIQKFMNDAPDELWLDVKVICIFAISGACHSCELPLIKQKDVESHGDVLLVRIAKAKGRPERSFTITGTIRTIVQKYADLRGPRMDERFFLNYQRGKCTKQVIGKNKFSMVPRRIAKFLHLPNPDSFTGNSFRRTSHLFQKTSATILTYGCIDGTSNSLGQNFFKFPIQSMVDSISISAASTSSISTAVSQPYQSSNTWNGRIHCANTKTDPTPPTATNTTKELNRKFCEIYCNPMGVLTYQCTLCPAQMDHSDEFSLHYMTHFRDVFPIKQELQNYPNDFGYAVAIEPISEIKLEEPQIKSEPFDSDDDEMSTEYSFGEIEQNAIVK